MTKEKALKKMRTIFWTQIAIATLLVILFETGTIQFTINNTGRYITDVAGIILTLSLIPLAIKGFSAQIEKAIEQKKPHFIEYYCTKSNARCSLLFIVIITNTVLYYSGNDNALYCALFGVAAAIYSYPSATTLNNYLQKKEEK